MNKRRRAQIRGVETEDTIEVKPEETEVLSEEEKLAFEEMELLEVEDESEPEDAEGVEPLFFNAGEMEVEDDAPTRRDTD